jgi:site-specific recombinase XerD/ribosomal protein L40E
MPIDLDQLLSEHHNLSEGRKKFIRSVFKLLGNFTEHALTMNKEEVNQCLEWLKTKLHTDQSWNGYVGTIRTVYKWLYERDGGEGFPDSVRRVKLQRVRREDYVRTKLLSEHEVRALIEAADNPRDKSMVSICWEGGFRLGELLSMTVGGCERTSVGYNVTVTGKTGTRTIPIVLTAPLLEMWLYCHPAKDNRESNVWTKRRGDRFQAVGLAEAHKILKVLAKRADLKRNVHWYMLRHSTATFYARNNVNEAAMRKVFGWTANSNMTSVYTHLVPGDVEDTVLALRGVKKVEKRIPEHMLEPLKCFKCGTLNPFDAKHCVSCGMVLDREEAQYLIERDKVLREIGELLKDPQILERLKLLKK